MNPFTGLVPAAAVPLRTLGVALLGTWCALAWYAGLWLAPAVVLAGVFCLGIALDAIGRSLLPRQPTIALSLMEWWMLAPLVLGVAGTSLVVVIGAALAAPSGTSDSDKEILKAVSSAIASFLAAA